MYETPRSALQPLYDGYLKDNVPTSSICFDPCCGHDAITDFLREMGYPNVIGYDRITKLGQQFNIMWDKFPKCDVVIINPIYSLIHDILELLIELGVLFCIWMPLRIMSTRKSGFTIKCNVFKLIIPCPAPDFLHDDKRKMVGVGGWFIGQRGRGDWQVGFETCIVPDGRRSYYEEDRKHDNYIMPFNDFSDEEDSDGDGRERKGVA